ncbi:MAG TPA: Holliday junction branch migration protein RuvA [Chloroflexia bacterium]|nr:Holliday junction branch migration protein RuvA [Chloroflexia bacterium]
MIVAVRGKLEWMGPDSVIVEVHGISYRLFVPSTLLDELGEVGSEVRLQTHLYVREDQMTLYGFKDQDQLALFELLMGVSGVGPRAALNVLSKAAADAIHLAIAQGDVDFLKKVPGIGVKTASRIILELKGKLVEVSGPAKTAALAAAGPAGQKNLVAAQQRAQVSDALSNLGYSSVEIQTALASLPNDRELSIEELVLAALQFLGQ